MKTRALLPALLLLCLSTLACVRAAGTAPSSSHRLGAFPGLGTVGEVQMMNSSDQATWLPGGTISVDAFGAKGDGVTDDSTAFQSAATACASIGATLFVPTSSYVIGTSTTFDPRVHVAIGNGSKFSGAGSSAWTFFAQGAQPSWLVGAWFFDPVHGSDSATGTDSSHPVQTVMGGIVARWGTPYVTLPQTTTITELSAETLGQEKIILHPTMVGQSGFVIVAPQANMTTVASFTLGTVTSKNRTTGVLLQAAGFSAGGLAVGQLVVNNTHPSRAFIYALSGGTATLMQPFVTSSSANATTFGYFPAEVDTWATGDSVTVLQTSLLNLEQLDVRGSDTNSAGTSGGWFWVQGIEVPDVSGTNGASYWSTESPDAFGFIVDSKLDPYVVANTTSASAGLEWIDDILMGGAVYGTFNYVIGGGSVPASYGLAANDIGNSFDGDVICAGGPKGLSNVSSYTFLGYVYVVGNLDLWGHSYIRQEDNLYYSGAALWGPGSLHVHDSSIYEQVGSVTFASHLLVTGGIYIDEATTATSYSSGTFTDGRAITAANLDTYDGLMNPKTGARICRYQ